LLKIALGNDIFLNYIKESDVYVDKTLFIKDIIDSAIQVSLITRPRRFGKTLNMTMLKAYFEKNSEDYASISSVFSKLKISDCGEIYKKEMNKYPVIFMSLKEVKYSTWEKCFSALKLKISEVFVIHESVTEILSKSEKVFYDNILYKTGDEVDFASSIGKLIKWLERYYKEKVVLLIDEYDAPINEGYTRGYHEESIDFIKNLFGGAMKTNDGLKKAILTGVTRIAGKSLFSELNNFKSYNVLSEEYSEYFGFTEDEVKAVLKQCKVEHDFTEIKSWYNGYTFGKNTSIYNPWSIMNVAYERNQRLSPHWTNTASNSILKNHLANKSIETKENLYRLIKGEALELPIRYEVTFNDLVKESDALWSFLLYAGYLTATNIGEDFATFNIPNYEVKRELKTIIDLWLTEQSGGISAVTLMINAMLTGDVELFTDKLSKFVYSSFSYFDTTNTEPELVYHAFILGLLVHLQKDYYFNSNGESGNGRADILIMPLVGNHKTSAVILEFKKTRDKEKLEESAEIAINQIKEKKYIDEARKRGATDIYIYGIGFYKKEIKVIMEQL